MNGHARSYALARCHMLSYQPIRSRSRRFSANPTKTRFRVWIDDSSCLRGGNQSAGSCDGDVKTHRKRRHKRVRHAICRYGRQSRQGRLTRRMRMRMRAEGRRGVRHDGLRRRRNVKEQIECWAPGASAANAERGVRSQDG
jgi:hypothetical protein